jgi:hypothetical protein
VAILPTQAPILTSTPAYTATVVLRPSLTPTLIPAAGAPVSGFTLTQVLLLGLALIMALTLIYYWIRPRPQR